MRNVMMMLRQAIAAAMFVAACHSAAAFEADRVAIKVGFSAGGSFDAAGRLVAGHLGRFLPGNPEMVVQNVTGGGGMRLTQLMLGSEPADGSVIATVSSAMALAPALDPDVANFDPSDLQWIGALASDPSFCIAMKDAEIASTDEFLEREFLVGATGKSSLTYVLASIVKNGLGGNFNIVTGFEGGVDIMLAMQRGEIAARCGVSLFIVEDLGMLDAVDIIGRFGSAIPDGLGPVPRFADLIEDPVTQQAAYLIERSRDFHLPFLAPAGTSPELLATLRQAFAEMVLDPAFLEDAENLGLEITFTPGDRMQAELEQQLAADPAVFEAARALTN